MESKLPTCPHCQHPLTWEEIKSLYGAGTQALRVNKSGNPKPVGRRKREPEPAQQSTD